ncbi:MAG: hypothetical protein OEM24_03605 [Paracoccaceae bacterium]|nr:hypothetical protein [Paracoccaceae bacterium]
MHDPQVLSHLAVRRALGVLGLALPAMLYAYARVFGYGMQPSISEFYHTHMGDLLVGCLVAIGVFLISYLGYPKQPGERLSDRWVARAAGLGALGVALFSVVPPDLAACPPGTSFEVIGDAARTVTCPIQGLVTQWAHYSWLHFASAALFFLALAVFCFFLFPRGDCAPDGKIDWSAPKNRIYAICGTALLLAIAFLGLYALLGPEAKAALRARNYVFWWETVGVVAFAVSWLAKGKIVAGVVGLMPGR